MRLRLEDRLPYSSPDCHLQAVMMDHTSEEEWTTRRWLPDEEILCEANRHKLCLPGGPKKARQADSSL
jgi:hypothetical protein